MGFRNNIDTDFYLLQLQNSNNIEARFTNSSGVTYDILSFNVLDYNQWQHLAFTYDGNYIRLYKNGYLLDSTLASGTITQVNQSFRLGSLDWQGTGFYMNGRLDEIRLWDVALSSNDIINWMCMTVNTSHPYINNLLANWKLDEGTGNTISDPSANPSLSGNLIGGTSWQANSNCTNTIIQNLCDSINTNFVSVDFTASPSLIHFNLNVLYNSGYWFGYCGFVLLDNNGDTIAYENINTAANAFGIGSGVTESRILEIIQNLSIPFYGELHLVEGYFAGNNLTSQCIFPFEILSLPSWDCISVGNCQDPGTGQGAFNSLSICLDSCTVSSVDDEIAGNNIKKIINILGVETKLINQPLFYIYDDGTVEKRIVIE